MLAVPESPVVVVRGFGAAAGFLVRLPRRQLAHGSADHLVEKLRVAHITPDLVVPAPDRDRGMMPDAQDLVLEFRLHVGDELLVESWDTTYWRT